MKLNLDFTKYIGTTRLKQWWKEVKTHFTQVQTAHNALEDAVAAESTKLATEITQRTNADIALSDRINAEANTRTTEDNALRQGISGEATARTEADNEIKSSISELKEKYLGDGSTVTFEWIGDVPEAELVNPATNPEPSVNIDLSGMFKIDGVPCGTMTETLVLLNYIEDDNGTITEFNNGITYIVASFNPKTKQISVTWSDTLVESAVTNNIWTFTAAKYDCYVTKYNSDNYTISSGTGTPYTGSATVDKENLEDKINRNSQMIGQLQNPIFTTAGSRSNIVSGEGQSTLWGKVRKWFADLKDVAFSGSYTDLTDKPAIPEINIKKNPDAGDGDIVDTHMTVGTRAAESVCGFGSFVSGEENAASKDNSGVIGGARNTANGLFSVIIGGADNKVLPTGTKSVIIGGDNNQANTINCVIIGGVNAVAARCNVVFGHRNVLPQAAGNAGIIGDAIVVGNGTVESESNAFRVAYNGNVYCGGEYSSTGADYAEMFEWSDGNPDNEDRRGLFAYIENGKMRLANSADTDRRRIGIISARPAVVGDDFDDRWCGKYMTDVFGAVMTHIVHHDAEEYTVMAKDPETGERVPKTEIIEAYDAEEPILNPDYDPEQEYIPRAQRKEYDCWAFMGKLVVCDDGTCEANGYCYPSENGIATAAEDGFYVLERIDETHVKVLIK